jgi:hypothetical protein
MASYRKPPPGNNQKPKPGPSSPVKLFLIIAAPLVLIAIISLVIANTMPSGAAEAEVNTKLASIYGATDIQSTDTGMMVTIDGTTHKCFNMSEEELKVGAAIQCDNGVLLNAKP